MRNIKKLIPCAALLMLAISPVALAKIYEWRDAQGVIHYSDQPKAGATEVDMKPIQTYTPVHTKKQALLPLKNKRTHASAQKPYYSKLAIVSPATDATFWNKAAITIVARFEPQLRPGDKIILLVDGARNGSSMLKPRFTVENLPRGQHVLEVQLRNRQDKLLATSSPVMIYVHQWSKEFSKTPGTLPLQPVKLSPQPLQHQNLSY